MAMRRRKRLPHENFQLSLYQRKKKSARNTEQRMRWLMRMNRSLNTVCEESSSMERITMMIKLLAMTSMFSRSLRCLLFCFMRFLFSIIVWVVTGMGDEGFESGVI